MKSIFKLLWLRFHGNWRLSSTLGSYLVPTQFLAAPKVGPQYLSWKRGGWIGLERGMLTVDVHEYDRSLHSSYFLCLVESPTNTQQLLFCSSVWLLKRISRMEKIVFVSFCTFAFPNQISSLYCQIIACHFCNLQSILSLRSPDFKIKFAVKQFYEKTQFRNDIINDNILHEIFVSGPNCDFD